MTADEVIALAGAGDVAGLAEALDLGSDPDARGARGWTPLIAAARNGHIEVVDLLLGRGASPDRTNPNGTTPLMYAKTHAFASGDFSVMDALLQAGADINAFDAAGLTVLDYTEDRSAALIAWLGARAARRATDMRG